MVIFIFEYSSEFLVVSCSEVCYNYFYGNIFVWVNKNIGNLK